MDYVDIGAMVGLTMRTVDDAVGDSDLTFTCEDGRRFEFWHEQDCCESVAIEDIAGDLADLVGVPILRAEERSEGAEPEGGYGTATWTFYEFATINGSATVRWLGESNGYYSESVSLRMEAASCPECGCSCDDDRMPCADCAAAS